ncbi:DUF4272 domain-containing protein [Gulosibacter hominis]|uniref:DUF4272 domain-containing protein n=1 Tax=Gulosibacter hominis TaxID=2770504 RepID=UPI0039BFC901
MIVPGHLPPVRSEAELTPADPAEVLNRAVVLAVIADLSEEIYRGDDIDLDDVVDLQGSGEVTETEAEFLEQLLAEARGGGKWSDDLRAKALNHSWGFVAAHTLAHLLKALAVHVERGLLREFQLGINPADALDETRALVVNLPGTGGCIHLFGQVGVVETEGQSLHGAERLWIVLVAETPG